MADRDVVRELVKLVERGRDGQARHYGLIALASIGARDTEAAAHGEQHDEVRRLLLREIRKPRKSRAHRSWAGLAAAIYGRGQPAARVALVERLREAYDEEGDPAFRGAFAIALGLLDDRSSSEQLFVDFQEAGQSDVRGATAVALGFLHHRPSVAPLRLLCATKGIEPALRLNSATALALMQDRGSVPVLVDALADARVLGVKAALSRALGVLGDQNAIPSLLDMAADERAQPLTRAFACVALGLICEKTPLPWHAAVRADNNYRAMVPSLAEILDVL